MTSTRFANPAILAILSLIVAASGIWTVYQESAGASGLPGDSEITKVVRSLTAQETGGLSALSQLDLLRSCATALSAPDALEMRFLPQETRDAVLPRCRQSAQEVTADFPTHSYAWAVGALASARSGDWDALNDELVRSQITGPTEHWVAELRVTVALDHYDELKEPARLATDRDLLMLMRSIPGSRLIAERYVSDVAFRDRIEALIATAPTEVQRRFISVIRREIS